MDREWLEQRALRYAARWETSVASVRRLLERKIHERCDQTGESPDSALDGIPKILETLVERGFVNDRRFASEALDRLRRQGRSRAQIRARLRAKGISESILDDLITVNEAGGAGSTELGEIAREIWRTVAGWSLDRIDLDEILGRVATGLRTGRRMKR